MTWERRKIGAWADFFKMLKIEVWIVFHNICVVVENRSIACCLGVRNVASE